ncbi:MAG: hypothetical protein ACI8RD_001509, partial [Bacillariaceae sp.]|jgi:hypothetical protein
VVNANIQFELLEKENELKRLRSLLLNKNKTMVADPTTTAASMLHKTTHISNNKDLILSANNNTALPISTKDMKKEHVINN